MSDWIDEELDRRKRGENRPLLQSEHAAVNARYPGTTLEYCDNCDGATGRAGRADDSIFCPHCGAGPFCAGCVRYDDSNLCPRCQERFE